MATNFGIHISVEELLTSINEYHTNYFLEDKLKKLKYREILQRYLKEFISIVPHKKKFRFPETTEILHRSVYKANFNALKASYAWSYISTYANNLFSQPWRKEYFEIKLYSGFYKHQIENHLSGAETMLELMGYKRIGSKMVFNGPINKNVLCMVSLDALTALCECEVLFSIHKEVSKHALSLSWENILYFREQNTGSADEAISILLSPHFCNSEYCSNCLYSYSHYISNNCRKCHETALRMQPAFVPMNGFHNYNVNLMPYSRSSSLDSPFNCRHCNHVPTAKLIDIDENFDPSCAAYRNTNCARWLINNENSKYGNQYKVDYSPDKENIRKRERNLNQSKITDVLNSKKSSDYICKKLENKEKYREVDNSKLTKNLSRNNKSNFVSEAFNNLKLSPQSESSIYFTEDTVDSRRKINRNKENFKNTLDKGNAKTGDITYSRATPNTSENLKSQKACDSEKLTWECPECTYYNDLSLDICEMCFKSRNVSNEIPLISGGKHCQFCTLVNKKEATKCEACDSNLQDSPTYV